MKTLYLHRFPSLLDKLYFTSDQLEWLISKYPLQFSNVRNQEVEWKIQFPIFLTSFYDFVLRFKTLPTQDEFVEHYLVYNQDFFKDKMFSQDILTGLIARIKRTYPSLIRDIHFAVMLEECGYNVIYSMDLDIYEGIDLVVYTRENIFAINLYTDTKNAHLGREKKADRHERYNNVIYIELPVSFKGSKKVGEFFLYSKREVDLVKHAISEFDNHS